jgi:catechol 2,3-dioxygenase-like lactoylglutathione lyase family enzyme
MQFERFSTTVLVDDVAAVRDFHVHHFGWRVLGDAGWFVSLGHDEQSYELCVLDRAHGAVPDGHRDAARGLILGYVVSDAAGEAERLRGEGVVLGTDVVDEPYGQRHFFVTDPAGVLIDVVQLTTPDPEWIAQHWTAQEGAA